MNYNTQIYKGIPMQLIKRNYRGYRAKRFVLNGTNQNVWIPNKHLDESGNIKQGENIDYVFLKSRRQCEIAGIDIGKLQHCFAIDGRLKNNVVANL